MSTDTKPAEAVREIKVKDQTILVDADIYPLISLYTWHVAKNKITYYAYATTSIAGKQYQMPMHRLLTGCRKVIVDHINGNGLDNRLANLRFATPKQNAANQRRKIGVAGYRGVTMCRGKYVSQCKPNGKRAQGGRFKTAIEAAKDYDRMAREHFGEFAILNFPEEK